MEYYKNSINSNINQSPNIKSGRQNQNQYKNTNNKSIKTRYISSSNKKSINQNYTIDSENNRVLFSDEDNKTYQNLANEVRIQNKILEEYQKWVSTLLSVIDNNKQNNTYNDIGTPIQQNLEYIEKLKEENFKIKTKIINQKINNENLEKILEKKQKSQNMIIKEFNEKDETNGNKIKKEKEQLIENVQMLANELDELNENNKNLHDKIMKDEKLKNIYELMKLKKKLKEENRLYKKIMVFRNRKNYIDLKETLQINSDSTIDLKEIKMNKRTINNENLNREYGSIGPISGCGEYKLEKEENIHSNGSIFFCGL